MEETSVVITTNENVFVGSLFEKNPCGDAEKENDKVFATFWGSIQATNEKDLIVNNNLGNESKLWGARVRRVKLSLVGAWIVSSAFATPQIFIYHVASHPDFPEFRQCVTKAFLKEGPNNELIYNVLSVSALYFIPLLVVIYTYARILWKLNRKSKEQRLANSEQAIEVNSDNATTNHSSFVVVRPKRTRVVLRCSENQTNTLSRARSRTMWLTLLILLTFIICWTPYSIITLWSMLDREGASQVNEWLQEALFLVAVANSVADLYTEPLDAEKDGKVESCSNSFDDACF